MKDVSLYDKSNHKKLTFVIIDHQKLKYVLHTVLITVKTCTLKQCQTTERSMNV